MSRQKQLAWIADGDCWRCTSHALNTSGYPAMYRSGVLRTISRWILIRRIGKIQSEIVSRHTCDNRWCIKPSHIIHGSNKDNAFDRNSRNRQAKGTRHGLAKLNPEKVRQIRKLHPALNLREIAEVFGVNRTIIRCIITGKTWSHVV